MSRGFKFSESKNFDPFKILGVDNSASIKDIKRAYRKLVLTKHPDRGGDVDEFLMITRAFKSLSDPIARENFERYGNPDGPINPSLGIALPSWLVNKKYSKFVLVVYFITIIIGLPAIIIIWWYYNRSFYSEKLLNNTVKLFVFSINRSPDMKWKRILTILCAAEEFEPRHCSNMSIKKNQEIDIHDLIKQTGIKQNDDPCLNQPYCVKARALLFSHLSRIHVPDILKPDLDALLVKLIPIMSEFQTLMLGYYFRKMYDNTKIGPNLETFLTCLKLSASIVQGVGIGDSPLMQLPHVDDHDVILFQKRRKNLNTVQNLVDLNEKDKTFLFKKFEKPQIDDILSALESMPDLNLIPFLKTGEDCENTAVEESGVVTIIFRVERSSLATKWHNSSTEKSLTEGESRELQCPEDCLVWRYDHPLKSPPLYFVHSPKFPILKKEGWWAYVLTSAEKFITAPIYFHFTKNTEFLKFQFQAPSFIGVSRYKCVIMSDSYLGFQFQQEITVQIIKHQTMIEDHPQWEDLSDEEGDKLDPEVLTDNEYPSKREVSA